MESDALCSYFRHERVYTAVMGSGFIGRDMTIQNTAGAVGQQAVALRASGDQQAFANMNLEGYQVC